MPDKRIVLPWTYFQPTKFEGPLVTCRVESALALPVLPEYHPLRDRLVLAVTAQERGTRLTIESFSETPTPVAAAEVFRANDAALELLGHTSAVGEFYLPRGASPLEIVYIRRGLRLIARLPVVPGEEPAATFRAKVDDSHLEIDRALEVVRDNLLDHAARRDAATARVRGLLAKKDIKGATEALAALKALPSADIITTEAVQAVRSVASNPVQAKLLKGEMEDIKAVIATEFAAEKITALAAEFDKANGKSSGESAADPDFNPLGIMSKPKPQAPTDKDDPDFDPLGIQSKPKPKPRAPTDKDDPG